MKIKLNDSRPGYWAFFGVAVVAFLFTCGPVAHAVEIAYEGFGYDTGYLGISEESILGDELDDGTGSVVDAAIDSQLGDPSNNGGTGPWVNGWAKRNPTTRSQTIDGDSTLSYTDSLGNALATTLGKAQFPQSFTTQYRTFDPSLIDPAITIANTGVNGDHTGPVYEGSTLGKQGTVVWFSMLGDFQTNSHNNPTVAIQFQNKRDGDASDGRPQSITGGITITGAGWAPYDVSNGEEDDHAPGTGFNFIDATASGDTGNIPGSAAADDAGTVFLVAKFDYNATFDFFGTEQNDGWADVSYWINPDLDAEPLVANADLTGSAFYPINGVALLAIGNADVEGGQSSLDEIRFGTTYADVAPIASAPGGGDYDNDGDVDGTDFLKWQRGESPGGATPGDLALWQASFGNPVLAASSAVPEPASAWLLGFAGAICGLGRRRNNRK